MSRRRTRETPKQRRERTKRNHHCSLHVWDAAKKRKVKYFGAHLWLVWGGKDQHVVYYGPDAQVCSCRNQPYAFNQTCCHLQAVKNTMAKVVAHIREKRAQEAT